MVKLGEHFQVASSRTSEIDNWPGGKEQTKHRTQSVKRDVDLCMSATGRIRCGELDGVSRDLFKLSAQVIQQFPAIDPLELAQVRHCSCIPPVKPTGNCRLENKVRHWPGRARRLLLRFALYSEQNICARDRHR